MKKLFEVNKLQNEAPYEVWTVDEPVPEIFADGTEGLILSDGVVKFSLYTMEIENTPGVKEPKRKKIITQRVVMPMARFFELLNRGAHVQKVLQQQGDLVNSKGHTIQ